MTLARSPAPPPLRRAQAAAFLTLLAVFLHPFPLHAESSTETIPGAVSLAEFKARLLNMDQLVAACQQSMTSAHCQSRQVGPDAHLPVALGSRPVRFAWLRGLLDEAAKAPAAPAAPALPANHPVAPARDDSQDDGAEQSPPPQGTASATYTVPTLAVQLAQARQRLAEEERQVSQLDAQALDQNSILPAPQSASPSAAGVSPQRQVLARILAGSEYHVAVAPPSLWDRFLEKVGNWVDGVFEKLRAAGLRSTWIGIGAEILFVLALCVGLAWFLIRLERQGRLAMAMIRPGPDSGAASARDWQLWAEDARRAAALGAWRDAIHFVYWASISRLESAGLWPADRARTPREYLSLLSPDSVHRSRLATLTASFERTWYAGRAAAESDFHQAEQLAAQLGAPSRTGMAREAK